MCVAGKYMIHPSKFGSGSIGSKQGQSLVFKPGAVGILSNEEWGYLQDFYDAIAGDRINLIKESCDKLGLFTINELKEYASKLN